MARPTTSVSYFAAVAVCWLAVPARAAAPVDYDRDVRPILSNHCYACHGPDEHKRRAGLRLDRRDSAFAELESGGRALVAGKPAESRLYQRVSAVDQRRMPPPRFGARLSAAQVDVLKRWIEQGAAWEPHWAYVAPRRPPLPAVNGSAWPRNAIDRFVLARLEREGLKPAPEADRATLLRRLSFDLTGLPPQPAEVDRFVADRRADAYEKAVDRLLASPHYGERMAQTWLDLARYADTNGYHIDNHRDMWKWRDWVISAFNANEPFDRFTVEQLAGDLLPHATLAQRVATGFQRNVMVNFEGGADPEEYLTKYVVDRVTTLSTVWLGTTLACTECHDHKFDPFTQKEFYQLYAFFNSVPEKGLDGQQTNPVPSLQLPSPEQVKRRDELRNQLARLERRLKEQLARVNIEPVHKAQIAPPAGRHDFVWVDDALPSGAQPQGDDGPGSWHWVGRPDHPVFSGALASTRTAIGLSQHFFTGAKPELRIGAGDKLFVYVYLDPKSPPRTVMLQFNDGTWEHRAYWGANLISFGADRTSSRLPMGLLPPPGQWVRLEVRAQDIGLLARARINGLALTQFGGTVYWDRVGIRTQTRQDPLEFDSLEEWEAWQKTDDSTSLPASVRAALRADAAKRTPDQARTLRDYFVQHVYSRTRPLLEEFERQQEQLKKEQAELEKSIPSTMVMEEMAKPRDTHVLIRGDFQQKGERVFADVPHALPPLPPGVKHDRLALARWLVDGHNPLTARVTVNHFWQQYFGTGIVKTVEDFGSQGEWPSHPELLDWLATEFVASGWDVKALQKQIVMSATYRQSARAPAERYVRDPENRLLARGPRLRLDAEMIRDQALAVSGLLDSRIGGPSVRPYQPPGLWETIAFGGGFSSQTYVQSKGADEYRRSLYVYWKRSMPYPSLLTFDAPNREVCCARRPRTSTPLQALVLLNDPVYVEAARALAERILGEGGADRSARLDFAFKVCTARAPTDAERRVLARVYEQQYARFSKDANAARQLISVGDAPLAKELSVPELAAWTAVANVILNLDETITKG